jgi:hypothetical protein
MAEAVIIAGVSNPLFDELKKVSSKKLSPNGEVFMKPAGLFPNGFKISQTQEYISEVYDYLIDKPEREPVSILLIYVDFRNPSSSQFAEQFFPFALASTIPPHPDLTNLGTPQRGAVLNGHIQLVLDAIVRTRSAADRVKHKLANKVLIPILLPVLNFRSAVLRQELQGLFSGMTTSADPQATLEAAIRRVLLAHPRERPPESQQTALTDGRLFFKSPGRERHGWPRFRRGDDHAKRCLLGSRSRLGAPFEYTMHFDCVPYRGSLARSFPNCHEVETAPGVHTHVNISPGDWVR